MSIPTITQAVASIKSGQRKEGRAMLLQIVESEPHNITALLWMTEVANTTDERRKYLSRILEVDPKNPIALKGLEILGPKDEEPPWMAQPAAVFRQVAEQRTTTGVNSSNPTVDDSSGAVSSTSSRRDVAQPQMSKTSTSTVLPKKKRKTGRIVLVVLLIVLLLGGSGFGWFYYYGPCGLKRFDEAEANLNRIFDKSMDAMKKIDAASLTQGNVASRTKPLFDTLDELENVQTPACLDEAKRSLSSAIFGYMLALGAFVTDEDSSSIRNRLSQAADDGLRSIAITAEMRKCAPFCPVSGQ
jgi:hypothetical protein